MNNREKKRLEKKLNKASGTCETLTKVLRFMLLESQKERSKSGAEKLFEKNVWKQIWWNTQTYLFKKFTEPQIG